VEENATVLEGEKSGEGNRGGVTTFQKRSRLEYAGVALKGILVSGERRCHPRVFTAEGLERGLP